MDHSLDSAIDFLVNIIATDTIIKDQLSNQLRNYVLGKTKYQSLHNDLRYPRYSKKYDSYSLLHIEQKDYQELKSRLASLKTFLDDLYKFTR